MEYLEANTYLNIEPDIPLIDVRSPAEYAHGHISGAFNIPIFTDEERHLVGMVYKQQGRINAIEKGLELVGPKLNALAIQGKKIAKSKKMKVYCWRGGMRSEKMSWLFELVGIRCFVLKGGYKAYRNLLRDDFKQIKNLIIFQGSTGTGKTEILRKMQDMGEQVLDLEKIANHRGSAFGHIGMGVQPTSQQFQNDLHTSLKNMDPNKRIWIESESLTIGKVYLPESLWERMNNSTIVELIIPRTKRIDRLVEEYGSYEKEILEKATRKIEKRFGGNNVKQVINYLEVDDLSNAAILLLKYYDKSYTFSQAKYKNLNPVLIHSESGNAIHNAEIIINKINELNI